MALGKTIQYTPFQETSFGYGAGEIASAHSTEFPNGTDIVRVRIGFITNTNWDETTGHISTPSVGTAVSTFNKYNSEWLVSGERDDVDAVLAQLKFFPSDYESTRIWTPTTWKDNQITGLYANEEPPTIPDTEMTLTIHDASDTFVAGYSVIYEADNYSYDNQRPYWSVEPTVQDVSALGIPPRIDLGTIAHGSETDNVTVTCEFRNYGSTSPYTGSAYGSFTQLDKMYVGDKKENTRNTSDKRFNFTGSLVEAQAFLDNIGYQRPIAEQTFDMMLRITDGAVGSEITKTCWFSDAVIGVSTLPNQSFTEDGSAWMDMGVVSFSVQPDATQFVCTLTFDATAQTGISHGYFGTGTYSNGTVTTTRSTLAEIQDDLRLIELYMLDDFDDDYTVDVDFVFSNPTLGTTYSSVTQTVNVTATPQNEISNPSTSHTYTEDQSYDFSTGSIPQIIHPIDRNFEIIFTISDTTAGKIYTSNTNATLTDNTNGTWTLTGSKSDINVALQNLYFSPNPDYYSDFTITFTVDRTSGDLTHNDTSNGTFTMTGTPDPNEYSFTSQAAFDWIEDTSKSFNTGIQVTDASTDDSRLPAYNTTYTVYMKMVDASGNDYNTGYLTSTSTGGAIGNAGGANPKTYTGTKAQVNQAIANMKYVPSVDITTGFYIQFKIVRDYDSYTIIDYSNTRQIEFNSATLDGTYSRGSTTAIDWDEDTFVDFNSNLSITDLATSNPDITNYYQTNYTLSARAKDNDGNVLTTATWTSTSYGSATLSGTGTVSDPLIITGSKADINTALANLRMIPDPDWTTSPATGGGFWLEYKITRDFDSSVLVNYNETNAFNSGADTIEYTSSIGTVTYTEDVSEQYIFSGINFIEDQAPNIHSNITYESTIKIANVSYGEAVGSLFGNYVEEGYIEEAQFQQQTYVVNTELTYSGTKADVNSSLQNVWFTPYRDNNASFDILYTQKRYINGVLDVTHATDVNLGTITATARLEVTLGTANSNIQYFVSDDNKTGVDTSVTYGGILNGNPSVSLTQRQIVSNMRSAYSIDSGLTNYQEYTPPLTLVDTYDEDGGESLYRFTVKSDNFPTNVSLATTDSGWLTRTQLQNLVVNGIDVVGLTDANAPAHRTQYTVYFKVERQTHSGIIDTIYGQNDSANNQLVYEFLTGLTLYKLEDNYPSADVYTRLDTLVYTDTPVTFHERLDISGNVLAFNTTSAKNMRDKILARTTDGQNNDELIFGSGSNTSMTVYGFQYTFGANGSSQWWDWGSVSPNNGTILVQLRDAYVTGVLFNHTMAFFDSLTPEWSSVSRGIHIYAWTPWGTYIRYGYIPTSTNPSYNSYNTAHQNDVQLFLEP